MQSASLNLVRDDAPQTKRSATLRPVPLPESGLRRRNGGISELVAAVPPQRESPPSAQVLALPNVAVEFVEPESWWDEAPDTLRCAQWFHDMDACIDVADRGGTLLEDEPLDTQVSLYSPPARCD